MLNLLATIPYFNAYSTDFPFNSIEQNVPEKVSPAPIVFFTLSDLTTFIYFTLLSEGTISKLLLPLVMIAFISASCLFLVFFPIDLENH